MLTCDNKTGSHTFCEVCVRQHLRETIFERHSPWLRCLGDGCNANYIKRDYERILDANTLAVRDRLEAKISLKNVEGMTACPNCDFAAFLDHDVTVFECQSPNCGKRFCVKCQADPHDGMSCSQAGKRKKVEETNQAKANPDRVINDLRRKVENMVSEALIRRCSDCPAAFVKEIGCNEMRCPCGNLSCYACKAQHITPAHWMQTGCLHFDATEVREEQERKTAEKKAIAQILKDNPGLGLTEKDLKIGEVSNRVKRDDKRKQARDTAFVRGEMWHPGMAIEGGDEDLMADMQEQMMGMNLDPFFGAQAGAQRWQGRDRTRLGARNGARAAGEAGARRNARPAAMGDRADAQMARNGVQLPPTGGIAGNNQGGWGRWAETRAERHRQQDERAARRLEYNRETRRRANVMLGLEFATEEDMTRSVEEMWRGSIRTGPIGGPGSLQPNAGMGHGTMHQDQFGPRFRPPRQPFNMRGMPGDFLDQQNTFTDGFQRHGQGPFFGAPGTQFDWRRRR